MTSKTTLRIIKGIKAKLSNAQIAKRLGRPLDDELDKRINKLRE